MQRRDAWTLKALRALLACLCVLVAFPPVSAAEPAFRPVAAALARVSPAPALVSEVRATPAEQRACTSPAPREPRLAAEAPRSVLARDGRRLYLEKRSLLC